jgi:hypothetical protein
MVTAAHDSSFEGTVAMRRDDKGGILCQEIVSFPVAELGPASCFGGVDVATETVTASSCTVKVLLFSKVCCVVFLAGTLAVGFTVRAWKMYRQS